MKMMQNRVSLCSRICAAVLGAALTLGLMSSPAAASPYKNHHAKKHTVHKSVSKKSHTQKHAKHIIADGADETEADNANTWQADTARVQVPSLEAGSARLLPSRNGKQAEKDTGHLAITAMGLIGTRYRFGGNHPSTGLDCSGFVRYVVQQAWGASVPRTSSELSQIGENVKKGELLPGDLVFYNTRGRSFSHVGIYLGDNKFVHAPSSGKRVRIDDMDGQYWQARFNGARRIAGAKIVKVKAVPVSDADDTATDDATVGKTKLVKDSKRRHLMRHSRKNAKK